MLDINCDAYAVHKRYIRLHQKHGICYFLMNVILESVFKTILSINGRCRTD